MTWYNRSNTATWIDWYLPKDQGDRYEKPPDTLSETSAVPQKVLLVITKITCFCRFAHHLQSSQRTKANTSACTSPSRNRPFLLLNGTVLFAQMYPFQTSACNMPQGNCSSYLLFGKICEGFLGTAR